MSDPNLDRLPPAWRRNAWAVLALLVVTSGWMAWQALGLQFNYDFEQFFPQTIRKPRFIANSGRRLGATTTFSSSDSKETA